ncbi:MAG: hypothetical protein WCS88_04895 [Patescibacteria group bacterium]|jgi:3D (Asp-Asp-Asp) domain-containing protein
MKNYIKNLVKQLKKELEYILKPLFLLVFVATFGFPQITVSQGFYRNTAIGPIPEQSISAYHSGAGLPEIPAREADRTMYIMVSAYNSEVGQTDDTPFITAFNTQVRDGIVATNFLPKGTLVRFPEVYGDKQFVVEDRMNKRYYYQMDIWMAERSEAIKFGSQFLKMEIL